jgi:calcineurin-like phosphoesterase family protein
VTQAGADQLNGARPSFTTPPVSGDTSPYSFAVLGDWGGGTTDETNVLSQIRSSGAQFVMTVGDNVYNNGTQTDYGDVGQGNVFTLGDWPGGQSAPWYPAQGNHGFTTNLPYLQNFPETSTATASGGRYQQDTYCCLGVMPSSHTYASAWYAFDWGNARFYVLEAAWSDSNGGYQGDFQAHWNGSVSGCSVCGQELTWLKSDLAAHAGTPLKFAFFHYPLHVDSSSQPSDTFLDGTNALEGVLANNGVKIAFNGHAHVYERNTPQISGTPMVSYVTGGGGADLGQVSGCSSFDAYAIGSGGTSCHAAKPTSNTQVFHFLKVSVNGRQVTVTPTDENGNRFDVQTFSF